VNNVWRHDLEAPNVLWFKADDSMSHWIESGLKAQAEELRRAIQEHMDVCGPGATICNIRAKALVEQYGSVDEAIKHEAILYNCLQDLAYLYTELGKITSVLYQIHELRLDSSKRGHDPELTDWEPRDMLAQIKATVTHRTEAGKTDTGLMPVIREGEQGAPEGAPKSILGLTDDLPDIGDDPVKPARKLPPAKTDDGATVHVALPLDPEVALAKDDVNPE
jgi:hypothetical protein